MPLPDESNRIRVLKGHQILNLLSRRNEFIFAPRIILMNFVSLYSFSFFLFIHCIVILFPLGNENPYYFSALVSKFTYYLLE